MTTIRLKLNNIEIPKTKELVSKLTSAFNKKSNNNGESIKSAIKNKYASKLNQVYAPCSSLFAPLVFEIFDTDHVIATFSEPLGEFNFSMQAIETSAKALEYISSKTLEDENPFYHAQISLQATTYYNPDFALESTNENSPFVSESDDYNKQTATGFKTRVVYYDIHGKRDIGEESYNQLPMVILLCLQLRALYDISDFSINEKSINRMATISFELNGQEKTIECVRFCLSNNKELEDKDTLQYLKNLNPEALYAVGIPFYLHMKPNFYPLVLVNACESAKIVVADCSSVYTNFDSATFPCHIISHKNEQGLIELKFDDAIMGYSTNIFIGDGNNLLNEKEISEYQKRAVSCTELLYEKSMYSDDDHHNKEEHKCPAPILVTLLDEAQITLVTCDNPKDIIENQNRFRGMEI